MEEKGVNRLEISASVTRLCDGRLSDDAATEVLMTLQKELPHSGISDLIFHDFRELTIDQIVDEAMRREADYMSQNSEE